MEKRSENVLFERQPDRPVPVKEEDKLKKKMSKTEKKLLKKRKQREEERDARDKAEEEEEKFVGTLPPKRESLGNEDEEDEEEEEEQENMFKPSEKGSKNSKIIDVDFELVLPSEAYYHSVRALLNQYLDGEDNE